MTTPTREQVVQWAKEATDNKPLYGWKEFTFSSNELQRLTAIARADLVAQLAERDAEIARLTEERDEALLIHTLDTGTESAVAALQDEIAALKEDAERYRWLRDATGETPLRPAAYNSEISPDIRLRFDFPTIVSYNCIGGSTTLDAAIDAARVKHES